MARCVDSLGHGGQRWAERVLGWNRRSIRKGREELENGQDCEDLTSKRGRKRAEEHLPNLLEDIETIVAPESHTDSHFQTLRLYSLLTGASVRRILINKFGYTDRELPGERTIRNILNALGYHPRRIKKSKPVKKLPETDAVFDEIHTVNEEADEDSGVLRISMDAKASVHIGSLSRGGKSRRPEAAFDHDFAPDDIVTPVGIFVPKMGESYFRFVASKVTADSLADCLENIYPLLRKRRPDFHTLVINLDNGPECSGRRTRWLERMVGFADRHGIVVKLTYFPPYHSKYNPIERVWGVLENHWRGELLTSVDKALKLARTMTYRGLRPISVRLVTKIYKTGVRLVETTKKELEKRLSRKVGLEPYFITIQPKETGAF